jgi:hypothetical protein
MEARRAVGILDHRERLDKVERRRVGRRHHAGRLPRRDHLRELRRGVVERVRIEEQEGLPRRRDSERVGAGRQPREVHLCGRGEDVVANRGDRQGLAGAVAPDERRAAATEAQLVEVREETGNGKARVRRIESDHAEPGRHRDCGMQLRAQVGLLLAHEQVEPILAIGQEHQRHAGVGRAVGRGQGAKRPVRGERPALRTVGARRQVRDTRALDGQAGHGVPHPAAEFSLAGRLPGQCRKQDDSKPFEDETNTNASPLRNDPREGRGEG